MGLRYISEKSTPYRLLVDEVESLAKSVGVEHVGIGWLGHDKGHPQTGYVPGVGPKLEFSGVEGQSIHEHWSAFIKLLDERGFNRAADRSDSRRQLSQNLAKDLAGLVCFKVLEIFLMLL